jgi:anti-anti-sigma regulatory factor/pSer/pThr/pTyr-binding forkhead associated (FHA) protein
MIIIHELRRRLECSWNGEDGHSPARTLANLNAGFLFRVMDDQLMAMLRYAAAVPTPLRLRVQKPEGETEDFETTAPYVIIGRGEGSHLRLDERSVSYRHVYLQAIGNRIACIDLLSVSGIKWSGPEFKGWLSPEHTMTIGSSQIRLADDHWIADDSLKPPLEFRPRDEQRPEYGVLPTVDLELLNTSHQGKRWPINRIITLLGRDDRCRITFADDRLSRVQCGLLLLPSGLWVIDLMGKGGAQLGGQPCRCGLLTAGAELTIGPYQVTAHYPAIAAQATVSPGIPVAHFDFVTRPNRIFQAEFYHDTLIIVPLGDSQSFFYQDLHIEASRIIDLITQRGFNHVVIDFSQVEQVGHFVLEALMSVCRTVPGQSALCGANPATYATLQTSTLHRLFDHYSTRQEALQVVYHPV